MKIAYIEDEDYLREDTKNFLLMNKLEVFDFKDSVEFYDYIKQFDNLPFDLFLVDIMLPGISGIEIIKDLSDKQLISNIPVLFISAISDEEKIIDVYNSSKSTLVIDYLTKPVSTQMFFVKINNMLKLKKYQDSLIEAKNEILKYNLELEEIIKYKEAINDYLKERLVKLINSQDKSMVKKIEDVKNLLPNVVTTDLSLLKFVHLIITNSKRIIENSVLNESGDEEEFYKIIPKTVELLKTAIVDIEFLIRSFINMGILDEKKIKNTNIEKTSFFEIIYKLYSQGCFSKELLNAFIENARFENDKNTIELF
jgi:FixJ family two-component response regulator